jgi:biopolymer transport protein ExbD
MKRARLALIAVFACSGCGSSQKCPDPAPPVIVHQTGPAATTSTGAPAPTVPNQPAPGMFRIEVAKDGALSIDGTAVSSPNELAERARTSAKERPDLLVVITSESDTPYGKIQAAYEIAKNAGFQRFALAQGKVTQTASAKPQQSVPMLASGSDSFKCEVHQHVDDIQRKSAFIAIHVGPDGVAQTVDILEDPGSGLGEAARACALAQSYRPAVDANGKPIAGVKKLRLFFQQHQH